MRKVLAVLAVAMLTMPAWSASANFSTTVDGSMSAYDGEGYTATTYSNDLSVRYAKGNQHYGFVGWTGDTKTAMSAFVGSNTITGGYLNVRAVVGQWDWNTTPLPTMTGVVGDTFGTSKAAIITMRTGNTGEFVEDTQDFDWACCIDNFGEGGDYAPASLTNAGGKTMPMAWRMADPNLKNPSRYITYGAGIDKYALGQYAGEPWKRPSTGDPAGIRSGLLNLVPGQEVFWKPGSERLGFGGMETSGGDGLMGFEAALGMDNSQGNNTIDRFEKAGQLVNKDANGNFRWMSDYAVGDGWYKIPLTPEIVADLINNPECKGLLFSGYVAGGDSFGNNEFARHTSDSGAYLTIDVTPEPATMVLLALGGLVALRRRAA
jgi:hypothetical protein